MRDDLCTLLSPWLEGAIVIDLATDAEWTMQTSVTRVPLGGSSTPVACAQTAMTGWWCQDDERAPAAAYRARGAMDEVLKQLRATSVRQSVHTATAVAWSSRVNVNVMNPAIMRKIPVTPRWFTGDPLLEHEVVLQVVLDKAPMKPEPHDEQPAARRPSACTGRA